MTFFYLRGITGLFEESSAKPLARECSSSLSDRPKSSLDRLTSACSSENLSPSMTSDSVPADGPCRS